MSYAKVEKVIDSCKTQAQLQVAKQFMYLFIKAQEDSLRDSVAVELASKWVTRAQMIDEGWV